MEHFKQTYGFYPKYPVADAGYGSYNNYIFCEQNGIEKYMKFPMFKKETKDQKYHEDPFRAVNFRIDEQGVMRCPNDKAFHFLYRKNVRGNQYGRKEELYECEDCSGCPYAEKCKKTDKITFHGADGLFDQTSYTFKTGEENPLSKIKYSDSAKAEAAKELKNYLPKITRSGIKSK